MVVMKGNMYIIMVLVFFILKKLVGFIGFV